MPHRLSRNQTRIVLRNQVRVEGTGSSAADLARAARLKGDDAAAAEDGHVKSAEDRMFRTSGAAAGVWVIAAVAIVFLLRAASPLLIPIVLAVLSATRSSRLWLGCIDAAYPASRAQVFCSSASCRSPDGVCTASTMMP